MRLKTVFHEDFSLSRPSIHQIISAFGSGLDLQSYKSKFDALRATTQLGSNYVKSMPRYCYGSGLLDSDDKLTFFGETVNSKDPLLDLSHTQWLMHYHLSAPFGPGPVFWHELVTQRFRIGDTFRKDEIAIQISEIYEREEGKSLAERSARSTATVFLGSYIKSDGLGNLGILEKIGDSEYKVLEPPQPPMWTIGCALVAFWQIRYPDMATIHLNDLYTEGFFTDIFMISKGGFNRTLENLQREGVIEVFRVAPPYQVALLNREINYYLEKMYGNNSY